MAKYPYQKDSPKEKPKDSLPNIAPTFGVEFEFVLAFHETELKRVLAENGFNAEIKKTLTRQEHEAFLKHRRSAANRRSHYPSWGLSTSGGEDTTISANLVPHLETVRRYFTEPLLIAQKVLREAGCPVNVIGEVIGSESERSPKFQIGNGGQTIILRSSSINYREWTLTDDQSVLGATKDELIERLPDQITVQNKAEWDSSGMELVSRMFDYVKMAEAMEEISKYLSALKGSVPIIAEPSSLQPKKTWGALESIWAGTHVHIGLNVTNRREVRELIPTLQHVAYIIFSHEDLITQLHPRHRSGLPRDLDWGNTYNENLESLPEETEEQTALRTLTQAINKHTGYQELSSNVRHIEKNLPPVRFRSWSHIRDAIFQEKGTMHDFVKLVQAFQSEYAPYRGFFVNFSNLYYHYEMMEHKAPRKPTIEFRQHACTLDVDELHHWVKLLFAIFRAAEAKVKQRTKFGGQKPLDENASFSEREGSKYLKNEDWRVNTVEEFCGATLLGLDEGEIEYWKLRYNKYNSADENLTPDEEDDSEVVEIV